MPSSNVFDAALYQPNCGRGLDDVEPYILSKQTGRARAPENTVLNNLSSSDKEKSSSVAKIKVVVCASFLCLNVLYRLMMFHF